LDEEMIVKVLVTLIIFIPAYTVIGLMMLMAWGYLASFVGIPAATTIMLATILLSLAYALIFPEKNKKVV
jgi:hypothetical protein